ncbi:MAG: hypothetical protein PHY30_02465 [Candidatus Pacebacteria bacterium]|nr:hypothetical protein [Candidatus Paceibacterota bacterium]
MTTEIALKKTFGWIFVFIGVIIILFTIVNTANYFTGAASFPQLFIAEKQVSSNVETSSMNELMQSMVSEQLNSFISSESINKMLNMSAWSLFAFFMVYAGAKIFELGLKFMKE